MEKNPIATFNASSLKDDLALNPDALTTLVRTKSLFSLPIEELLNKQFIIKTRLLDESDDINAVSVHNSDDDAKLRNRIRFVLSSIEKVGRKSVEKHRVALSVRQILSLNVEDENSKQRVSDLIYAGELASLPQKIKFVSVEPRSIMVSNIEIPMYPSHLYKAFAEKQAELRKLHYASTPTVPFNFGTIYEDFAFLATLHGSPVVDTASDADILKSVIVKVDA
jgi:hypothetical protein